MSQSSAVSNPEGYDLWSSFYDAYPNPTVAIDELHFPRQWEQLQGKDILEIGCGTGRHTQKLVKQGNRVTGIDFSPGMLAVARKKITGTVRFIQGDFTAEDHFEQDSFDAVVVSLVLEHIADLNGFFKKVQAVLRPGGALYVSEIHPVRTSGGVLAHFKTPDGDGEVHLTGYVHTEQDFNDAASAAGFMVAHAQDVPGDELARINPKWQKHVNVPMIKIWTFQK